MSTSSVNFGTSIALFEEGDAFFVDTNFIVALHHKTNKYHKACSSFFLYLMMEKADLYVTEVVIKETMHVLARILYSDDEYTRRHSTATHSNRQKKDILGKLAKDFPNLVKSKNQDDRNKVGIYNEKAWKAFQPFLTHDSVHVIGSDKDNCISAIELSIDKNLLSADSHILNMAQILNAEALISLDGDIQYSTSLKVYTTRTENEDFNIDIYQNYESFEELKELVSLEEKQTT